jgi:hypothetical protein
MFAHIFEHKYGVIRYTVELEILVKGKKVCSRIRGSAPNILSRDWIRKIFFIVNDILSKLVKGLLYLVYLYIINWLADL